MKKPIQLYIPENADQFLDTVVQARKDAGDKQANKGQIIREALAEKFGLSVEYFSVGEWGVRTGEKKGD